MAFWGRFEPMSLPVLLGVFIFLLALLGCATIVFFVEKIPDRSKLQNRAPGKLVYRNMQNKS